ncbi:MAG: hypothetical protein WAS21_15895 [Geminicoccaceae bacterium]
MMRAYTRKPAARQAENRWPPAHDVTGMAGALGCHTGNSNQKVEPLPGSERKSMRPPCRSTSALLMWSPRPVPPLLRVLELSARANRSKIRP